MNQKRRSSDPVIEQLRVDIKGMKADNKAMKSDISDIKIAFIGDIKDTDATTFITRLRDVESFVKKGRKLTWVTVVTVIGWCVKIFLTQKG